MSKCLTFELPSPPTQLTLRFFSNRIPVLLSAVTITTAGARSIPVSSSSGGTSASPPLPLVQPNDNRNAAGRLENGILTIRLVVKMARWYPEASGGPFAEVPAIAEEGRAPQIPAPLIRVPVGTTIVATVRNTLTDSTVYVRGFSTHPAATLDSIPILPGESRTIRFAAGAPGTYPYLMTPGIRDPDKSDEREASGGALIVDAAGSHPADRIFVINIWGETRDSVTYGNALAINGKSWPFTERIAATVGDTLRWRIVNVSGRNHPMHLHGFYFRLAARGTPLSDTVYSPGQRRLAVTEDLSAGDTMDMDWIPNRPGNWLFHCHIAFHVVPGLAQLSGTPPDARHLHSVDIRQHMAGLVLGINVRARPGAKMAARPHPRKLHLFVDEGRRRSFAPRAMGFVLQRDAGIPARDSIEAIGSLIVLNRDEPTDITVVNRLPEATSIHWHGIELESYSDGVAGWSGSADHLAPVIAAQDSFIARLTLPRAGTFIYHTHLNDIEQLTSRLYGALVVLRPGQKFDSATDHVFVLGWDGPTEPPRRWLINGDTVGPPIEIAARVPQRFRFVDIAPAGRVVFSIVHDSSVVSWRPLAKDGAAYPPGISVSGPAKRRLNVGETFDAEFIAPAAGEYELTMGAPVPGAKPFYRRRLIAR